MSSKIPVIDFSNQDLKQGSPEWDSVKVQVREALEEYGCFEARFDRVLELRKSVIEAMEEVFHLPLQTKQLCVSDKLFRAYWRSPSGSLETMSTDDAHIAKNIEQNLTNTLWPQGNITVSKTMASLTELASGLEKMIRRMILESFGLEKYFDELIDSTNYIQKLMKYKAPETDETTVLARAHYDQNMVTLLYQPCDVHGLEIQSKDGEMDRCETFIQHFRCLDRTVSMCKSIEKLYKVWLNGRLSSSYHRVVMKGNTTRYCVGIFATPRGGYQVKSPKEVVDDKNPMLFKPFDYEEFLGFYSTQILARGAVISDLIAYCSV